MARHQEINELEVIYLHGMGMTHQQIGDKLGYARTTVTKALARIKDQFPELLELEGLDTFRRSESDQITHIRQLLLKAMKQKVLKMDLGKVTFQQLSVLYGILFDKDRILHNQPTELTAHAHIHQMLGEDDIKTIKSAVQEMTKRALTESTAESRELLGDSNNSE